MSLSSWWGCSNTGHKIPLPEPGPLALHLRCACGRKTYTLPAGKPTKRKKGQAPPIPRCVRWE